MLMKFSKLLVLSALFAFTANSAKAGVPEGIWKMPVPEGLEFTTFTDDETHYYLYNPGANMFFASGNSWNTQACVRTFGNEVWLISPSGEADAPEGSYELWNNNANNPERQTGNGNIFTGEGNANQSYVDHASQANYSWAYEINGEFVRLTNVAFIADYPEYEGTYLGWDGTYNMISVSGNSSGHLDPYASTLRLLDPAKEGVCVDWKAVTVESYEAFKANTEAYNAYVNGTKAYIASFDLKKAIEEAEALGNIDVTAALAIYTNTASTADELTKAADDLNKIIDAKKKLQAAIEEYESKGFTGTADAKAVLTNPQATVAEVEAAHKALDEAYIEWGKTQASVENPSDMTTMIVNPHFDNGDCTTGWSGDAFGRGGTVSDGAEHYNKNYKTYQTVKGLVPGIYAVGVKGYYRAGSHEENAQHWVANDEALKYAKLYAEAGGNSFETPIVNVLGGAQAEDQNQGDVAVTYTDGEGNEVTVYAPNSMATGDYYIHTLKQYANTLLAAVDEDGELTIGVKKATQLNVDWSFFDDFSLTFYGNAVDAWTMFLEYGWNYEEITLDEDEVLFTESYLEAYNEAAGIDLATLTTPELIKAALAQVKTTYDALQKNLDLWKQFADLVKEVDTNGSQNYGWTLPWQENEISDYLYDAMDIVDGVEPREYTNEELQAEIDKLNGWIEECKTYAKENLPADTDVTDYIINADFEHGVVGSATDPRGYSNDYGTATGWTNDKFANGNCAPGPKGYDNDASVNHSFEAWHCFNFDVWQEVNDLPEGIYEINVQGYVRCEAGGYDRGPGNLESWLESSGKQIPVKLYLNNSLNDFPDIYSEYVPEQYYDEDHNLPTGANVNWTDLTEGKWPDSMGAAGLCFNWGMYHTQAYGPVKKGNPMRIGVKSVNCNENWWVIWDNFHLHYWGYLPNYVKDALEKALAAVTVSDDDIIGKDVRENAEGLIAQGNTFLAEAASHDAKDEVFGKQMFDVLYQIYDIQPAVENSKALFAKLETALENLQMAIYGDNLQCSQATIDAANALWDEVDSSFDNLTDAQAEEYLKKIELMITALAMPDVTNASDENPVEVTGVIKSASFSDEYDQPTSEGWTNPANLGNDDAQKAACAMEAYFTTIDMYQDINGLPAGTYILKVDGFEERAELNWQHSTQERYDDNYKVWQENNDAASAFLYGTNGEGTTYSAGIPNLMKGDPKVGSVADDYLAGATEVVNVTLGEGDDAISYYWPTSLLSGRAFLDLGKTEKNDKDEYVGDGVYTVSVVLKVNEDGKLRVGIKKDPQPTNVYWELWDNFRLFYCGANSALNPSGNPLTVESVTVAQPVKVEFFTLDGRKTTGQQKGIFIQKLTLDNGSVIVSKIRK